MKKILIVYASKTGTTKKCVNEIMTRLQGSYAVVKRDLAKKDLALKADDLSEYDAIIVGSPIRMGRFHKSVKSFLKRNMKSLMQKDLAMFVCCASDEALDRYFSENVPFELLKKVELKASFGGEYHLNASKGVEKKILESIMKSYITQQKPMPSILMDRIEVFCSQIDEHLSHVSEFSEEQEKLQPSS